jgi:hypothetical protein
LSNLNESKELFWTCPSIAGLDINIKHFLYDVLGY